MIWKTKTKRKLGSLFHFGDFTPAYFYSALYFCEFTGLSISFIWFIKILLITKFWNYPYKGFCNQICVFVCCFILQVGVQTPGWWWCNNSVSRDKGIIQKCFDLLFPCTYPLYTWRVSGLVGDLLLGCWTHRGSMWPHFPTLLHPKSSDTRGHAASLPLPFSSAFSTGCPPGCSYAMMIVTHISPPSHSHSSAPNRYDQSINTHAEYITVSIHNTVLHVAYMCKACL